VYEWGGGGGVTPYKHKNWPGFEPPTLKFAVQCFNHWAIREHPSIEGDN